MRITSRLTAVLAVVLMLAGCSTTATGPTSPTADARPVAAPAIELVPAIWRVRDARGEAAATWVGFDADRAEVYRPKGIVELSWQTQGDATLSLITGWSMSLGKRPTVPWLTGATRFGRVPGGWVLLDASGAVTARLVTDGTPPPSKQWLVEVPKVTADTRMRLADATPGAGVRPVGATALVGRWGAGYASATPSVTFTAAGRWSEEASCDTGTGAVGGAGAYRLLPSGMLLMTSYPTAAVGCSPATSPIAATAGAKAISAMFSARSVRIRGTTATFYDRAGKAIGSLTRRTPRP